MKYEEIKLTIPTEWNDISIGMYQEFVAINKKKMSEEEKIVKIVCCLCEVEESVLERFKYKDLKYISDKLVKLVNSEMNKDELIKKVEFNGERYGIIPNFSSISLGEFVDIEGYCKNSHDNLHKIMSIMYRPIVKEKGSMYSIEGYKPDEYKEDLFKGFPILASISALSFFFRLGKKLKLALLKYSLKQTNKEIAMLKRLQRSGVGTT
jgi:hypothetical protein